MKTIQSVDFEIKEDDFEYNYQSSLITKLDSYTLLFNQAIVNEIVLWKVNRYAELRAETLSLINQIDSEWAETLIRNVLYALLSEKGVQLPIASTILRFRNKHHFQIIDQRVYRILYGHELKINQQKTKSNILKQIDLYLKYLERLREACSTLNISFEISDRVFYNADKRINTTEKLKNY